MSSTPPAVLRIGFIGSGFNTRFHLQALVGVRDVEVHGIYSPTAKNAQSAAALARALDLGPAKPLAEARHRRTVCGDAACHAVEDAAR